MLPQLSDEAAMLVGQSLLQQDDAAAAVACGPEGAELLQLVRCGDISWRPTFQLHHYIIDESYCDHGDGAGLDAPAIIRYHPAHALGKRSGAQLKPEPDPQPEPEPELADAVEPQLLVQPEPQPGQAAFSFAELFAGIGGFRVGLEACGGRCVFSSEINPWAKAIYALNFPTAPPQQAQVGADVLTPHRIN
jgi:hypothetical protein